MSNVTNLTMQYCYVHHIGCDFAQLRSNHANFTLEYSKFYLNNQSASCHGDVFEYDGGTASGWVHRYNWFDECQGTYLWGSHESGTLSNAQIYGNIVSGGQMDNALVSGLSGGGTITGLKFYNNTIANVSMSAGFGYLSRGTNNLIYNNLWYNSPAGMEGTHDYNWFYGSGTQSESHIQNGSGNPFVDIANGNYALKAATNAGISLGSPYNVDMMGNTRSQWTRGALEYSTLPPSDSPSAPENLRILSQ
jgi:hypothetical protein